jgi:hypothetical protein
MANLCRICGPYKTTDYICVECIKNLCGKCSAFVNCIAQADERRVCELLELLKNRDAQGEKR